MDNSFRHFICAQNFWNLRNVFFPRVCTFDRVIIVTHKLLNEGLAQWFSAMDCRSMSHVFESRIPLLLCRDWRSWFSAVDAKSIGHVFESRIPTIS